MNDYAAACARAATNQGLDPLAYLLDVAGVEYTIDQTGGFCMVLTVQVPSGIYGVIKDGETDADWLVVHYPGNSWNDGTQDGTPTQPGSLDATVRMLAEATSRIR